MAKRLKKGAGDGEQSALVGQPTDAPNGEIHHARIRERAYELYLERGDGAGDEVDDWLRAEREFEQEGDAPRA
jgi:hypothetical protein